MERQKFDNEMRRQVRKTPSLLRNLYNELEPRTRYALTTPDIYGLKRIIITGCGDSHAAALTAGRAFEHLTECVTEVIHPLDLARFFPSWKTGSRSKETLVIAMSISGATPRVVEAADRMHNFGAIVLAVTGKSASQLAQYADKTLQISLPKLNPAPGTVTYAAMLFVCYLLAIRFGEVRLKYTMDTAGMYRKELLKLLEKMEHVFDQWDEAAFSIAGQCKDMLLGEMIGSGYDYGSAYYGCAKLYEAVGIPAMITNSEEWFHIHCFSKLINNALTIVFDHCGNESESRTLELMERMNYMKKEFVYIGNGQHSYARHSFSTPETDYAFLSPFIQWIPAALTASYLGAIRGESYHRGFQGIWREESKTPSSWNSKIAPIK